MSTRTYYDGLNEVLEPFRFDAKGKPCGQGYISANKECRGNKTTSGKSRVKQPDDEFKVVMSKEEEKVFKKYENSFNEKSDEDLAKPNTYGNWGIDIKDPKYKNMTKDQINKERERRKKEFSKDYPKGYFNKYWNPETEYQAKNKAKMSAGEIKTLRAYAIRSTPVYLKRTEAGTRRALIEGGLLIAGGLAAYAGTKEALRRMKEDK